MNDREAITAAIEAFAAAYNASDLTTILDGYDDDLIKFRQGAEPESKAETAVRVKGVFERFRGEVRVENVEIELSGDLAFTRGAFQVLLTPRGGGETQRIARRYLEVWRRREGRWRVLRTFDNTGPAPITPSPRRW